MRRFLIFVAILQIVHGSCPVGFDLVRDGECRGNYSWFKGKGIDAVNFAISTCAEIQGRPIIIHDEEHNNYWNRRVDNRAIMGLVCTSKYWTWVDGKPVDFKPLNFQDVITIFNDPCVPGNSWVITSPQGLWGMWNTISASGGVDSTDIFCTTQLEQPIPSGDGCEENSEDGACYLIGAAARNLQDAQKICRNLGASLASIHNPQENSAIRRLAVANGAVNGVLLGATFSSENKFEWIDGTDWDYTNFNSGYPQEGGGDCLSMDTSNTAGQWTNIECATKLPVACVHRQPNAIPACTSGPWKEGQTIYSPGFPYDSSIPCDWFLTVDEGKKVEVQVHFLEANSCCDHLILTDTYVAGKTIANLTGEISDKTYTSDSNFMRVTWQPTGGVNVKGMIMSYRGV